MTRQISKGICAFCHRELSKGSMTRHLASCEQRIAIQSEKESHQKGKKTTAFHLLVAGYRLPMYWMHLEVAANIPLAIFDNFLRSVWLECCGHLSVFRIDGYNYYVDDETGIYWDSRRRNMHAKLKDVLVPGQTSSYEYDFGTTTELVIKVISEEKVDMGGKAIHIIARNSLLITPCIECGEPATHYCIQCLYKDKEVLLCDSCSKQHTCKNQELLSLANSPRAGVCGYTKSNPIYETHPYYPQ